MHNIHQLSEMTQKKYGGRVAQLSTTLYSQEVVVAILLVDMRTSW